MTSTWLLPALLSLLGLNGGLVPVGLTLERAAPSAVMGSATAVDTFPQTLDPTKPLSQFNIELWTEREGLPQNIVTSLAQTPDGYLWLGMEEGLVRFDGVRFRVFGPSNTPAFSTPWVTELWVDPDGSLLIGTNGGGVLRMQDGVFGTFADQDDLSHSHIQAIFRDRSGTLWVGTNGGGLNRITDEGVEVVGVEDGLSNDFVIALEQDSAGSIWVATVDGLNRLDSDGNVEIFRSGDGLAGNGVRDLTLSHDGSLWVGTTDGGVSRLRNGRFVTYSTDQGLTSNHVTVLHEDRAGALWVGTQGGGVNRIYEGQITSLTTEGRLPSDLVLALGGDREGNLWLGLTGAGLARLSQGMFTNIGSAEGLSADIALALLEERHGTVWIGTAGGGVNRLRNGRFSTFTTSDGLASDVVLALAEGTEGEVWVGTTGGGISRVREGRVQSFDEADGVVSAPVGTILRDRHGNLWLGTRGSGLQRWRPGPSVVYTRTDGLPDAYITALHEDDDGTLWVGTQRGLARMRDGRIATVPTADPDDPSPHVSGIHRDAGGALWVTTDRGLGRVRDGRITAYGRRSAALGHEFHAAIDDSLGYLWLTSNNGILRIAKEDVHALDRDAAHPISFNRYGKADGLRSAEANGGVSPAALKGSDGTLWFPTMKGVAVADPALATPWRPMPTPIIEHIVSGDSVYQPGSDIHLPPGSNSLEIHFTAPTFVAPEELRFRYMLDGFDSEWVEAQDRRAAYYTNVPPGSYQFLVAARRGNGEWTPVISSADLVLAPYFYETPAFLFLVVLGLVGLGAAGYRLRIRNLTRRERVLLRVVAERERTERALRLSEERLRLALEAGRMGTWEWNAATGEITASDTTTEIIGFTPDTVTEARERLAAMMPPEHLERLDHLASGNAEDSHEFDLHFPITRQDGERRHVEVRGRTFTDSDGRLARVAGVIADITVFMNAQEELRRSEEELRQAQKMEAVGRLAGGVAHDFNNLLTAISGRTELVLERLPTGAGVREDVTEIRDAAQRATNLTQQLLTFSRKQVYQPVVLDLNDVIRGVERMLRRLIREDVVLETHLDPDLGHVRGDPGGMEQILLNLIVNAQDAMPDGGRIVIETRNGQVPDGTEPEEQSVRDHQGAAVSDHSHVILTVSDTGHGMTEEVKKHVFDPFFTTKPLGKGTGLGLSTVYGIVQQSGAQIRLESEVGRGTTFDLYMPLVEAPVAPSEKSEPGAEPSMGSETILLVEDEPAVRSLARKILERRGYTVLDAASGADALEIATREQGQIHMLVSDVVMPGMGGRELAERMQALRPGIPVLLMSGYNEDEVLRRGARGSGINFIQKPFGPDDLTRRVRQVLDREGNRS